MTRRHALLGVASAAVVLRAEPKQKLPSLCVSSKALSGVGYAELGEIVKQLGFDGVNITVMPGGLVEPQMAPVDEVRAFESIHGAGLEAPIITTALATPYEAWCRTVLALAGRTGVGLATLGLKRANFSVQTKRDLFGLASFGREYKIAVTIMAGAGDAEFDLPRAQTLLSGVDRQWAGICLSSSAPVAQFPEALPLVKAVSLSDSDGKEARPLGKGKVDFTTLLNVLAHSGFTGPVTVHREYKTGDEPGSLSRDCEFARKLIQSAYANLKT